jgi:hypothetical protein
MPGGRPSKYTEECLERAASYLDEWQERGDVIPSQAGLALHLGVSISCVEKWAKHEDKQEFLRVLDEIQSKQRTLLLNKGLGGDFNSNIAKLVLGKHGFSDRQEVKHSGSIGLAERIQEARKRGKE